LYGKDIWAYNVNAILNNITYQQKKGTCKEIPLGLQFTKSFINSIIETPMDLHKRRIQWAIDKLNEEGKVLTITNITAITGVGNRYRKQVVEEIKRALGELGEK
jgi:hypothetical protein